MKGIRSFLVLLAVLAALTGYLYYDSKREPTDENKNEKVFAGIASDKIERVTVKSASGDQTTVEKQGAEWQMTQPAAVAADGAELSGITSNLASLEVQRVVDEQATDLKQYGLDPARIEVTFKFGGKDQKLLLGQKTPTGSDVYAKVPDKPRVFLVASYLESTFNKSTFDLRDKTILKIDREKVDRVEIETADRTLKIAKQGTDWRLTSPVDARADFGAVEGIVGRLNTTPMKAITAAEATDLKEYGLDKPAATVRVMSGSAQAGLAIGKSAGEGVVYAKDLSRPMVFTVESALFDELKKPTDDFRVKDLFDARSFNTTRVEVARGGQTMVFEKETGKDTWKQVAPSAKAADTAKVEALLKALSSARATSFPDKDQIKGGTGLEAPEVTIGVAFEDGKKHEKVAFARKGTEAYALRDGDAAAAKIDTTALDEIIKAIDALK